MQSSRHHLLRRHRQRQRRARARARSSATPAPASRSPTSATPPSPTRPPSAPAQAHAEEILERGAQWLGHPEVERHVVLSGSTGEGLRALAEREGADLVVFGSDWHTAPGHVQPGQSALRLIEGGPVSIAIAAAGLRDRDSAQLRTVALAGGEFDEAARATAERLAALAGQPARAALARGPRPAGRRLAPGHAAGPRRHQRRLRVPASRPPPPAS